MTEQAVSRNNSYTIKKWTGIFRAIDILLVVILVFGEMLGFSMLPMYRQLSEGQGTQWIILMAIFGVPLLAAALALWSYIRRINTEYDYELSDNEFSVYRIAGGRRKLYLSFDMTSVTKLDDLAGLSPSERRLSIRSALRAFCNEDAATLTAVHAGSCTVKGRADRRVVVIEPNEAVSKAMERAMKRQY